MRKICSIQVFRDNSHPCVAAHKITKTTPKPPSLLSSPLLLVAGATGQQLEECAVGLSRSRSLGPPRGGALSHPNPSRSTLPRRGGWLRECRDQEGRNFSLEDLPEKCHAGSDEERNLDRERGREGEKGDRSQLKLSLSVSSWFCRVRTDDGPVAK